MKLRRLEVVGFGRVQQRTIEFGEHATVILGRNEAGKSTVHRAIRAALYGLDAGGQGRPREKSAWARWAPWESQRYGIALTYELANGPSFRVAQVLDGHEPHAQVHEVGGTDVTAEFRQGRLVAPGAVHLGIDETVFCAVAWLGEGGLEETSRADDQIHAQAIQRTIERLADSARGATVGEALVILRDAERRISSERSKNSALSIATEQLRQLDAQIDEARQRHAAFGAERERYETLLDDVHRARQRSEDVERAWITGQLAALYNQQEAIGATNEELTALDSQLQRLQPFATFPIQHEERVVRLNEQLSAAERVFRSVDAKWQQAKIALDATERKRASNRVGLEVLRRKPAIPLPIADKAQALRANLAAARAVEQDDRALEAALAQMAALDHEINEMGLSGMPLETVDSVHELVQTATKHVGLAKAATAFGTLLMALGVLAILGPGFAAHLGWAIAAGAVATLAGVVIAGGNPTFGAAARARRELAHRLPAIGTDHESLIALREELPSFVAFAQERQAQRAIVDARRADVAAGKQTLLRCALQCQSLAREVSAGRLASLDSDSTIADLSEAAEAALGAVDQAVAESQRQHDLLVEDARLEQRQRELRALHDEWLSARGTMEGTEHELLELLSAVGIDRSLPPMLAVQQYQERAQQRRQFDDVSRRYDEAQRRSSVLGSTADLASRKVAVLEEKLRERGGDVEAAHRARPLDPTTLHQLELQANSAREMEHAVERDASNLKARIDGALGHLPALADLEDERQEAQRARDHAIHQGTALRRAAELLEQAGTETHRELAPRLSQSVRERLQLLTESRYDDVNVDTDHFVVSLKLSDRADLTPLHLASHGTRDQVALLLRLALTEVLSKDGGEPIPLLLDEPVLSADPERRRSLLAFLARLAESNQLVVTTSDPSVAAQLNALIDESHIALIDLDVAPQADAQHEALRGIPRGVARSASTTRSGAR